ncbi:MAG: glycyl-radical enzyme activating protein [Clostridia bacterium]|nr:glycyl-radical enzyme activating protein [Clostridia bacterium]
MTGTVFSIEEFATFDGPGIRMTVFLKGCPLRCTWCHNPEGQRAAVEYRRSPNGCTDCGACLAQGEVMPDGTKRLTEASMRACPRGLVRRCGDVYTSEALCAKILANARLLSMNGGGVTFSGGEPTAQAAFLRECLSLLGGHIHRAVQSCGYTDAATFSAILADCDYMLYDLKLIDPALHCRYCGVDNAPILRNYRSLAASGLPFVTRIPLIPGVTDTAENLEAIAALMQSCGVDYAELLPYNRMAGSKYASVLREYDPQFDTERAVASREDVFARHGIRVKIM